MSELPHLRIAIERLSSAATPHYAIWVVDAPYPGGYVHQDRPWPDDLSALWETWLQFFSLRGLPLVPHVPSAYVPQFVTDSLMEDPSGETRGQTSRLMQTLGVRLWQWLFEGEIKSSWDQSLGIAIGQGNPLCLCLDIRDPDLIALPWEIMQPQAGRQAISLNEHVRFSRTTSDVDPLVTGSLDRALKILLVLGEPDLATVNDLALERDSLQLNQEAQLLKRLLQGELSTADPTTRSLAVPAQVDVLLRPTPAELIKALERSGCNIFFYAGHGVPAPDGGLLFVQRNASLNGTELAQVLTANRVKLAVFNTCWGAQPDQQNQRATPRSSLAEVLLHHGVPAVLAMRDSIADDEALTFIQVFTRALAERTPVDRAVAIARQHLLTVYKFNQPAWTLPVLYMHPDFDGQLLASVDIEITRLPGEAVAAPPTAFIRSVEDPSLVWYLYGGILRVGRRPDNDVVIPEPWVSGSHGEIFYRTLSAPTQAMPPQLGYYLRDDSRYGTFCQMANQSGWQHIHRQEIGLLSGTRLRFGSPQGRLLEFVIEG